MDGAHVHRTHLEELEEQTGRPVQESSILMKFENRLKGNVTQTLISSLLEDAGYRIVPLGVEEVARSSRSNVQTKELKP